MKLINKLKEIKKETKKVVAPKIETIVKKYIVMKEGVIVKIFDTKKEADIEAKVLGCRVEEK
jgi:hypothetical protein